MRYFVLALLAVTFLSACQKSSRHQSRVPGWEPKESVAWITTVNMPGAQLLLENNPTKDIPFTLTLYSVHENRVFQVYFSFTYITINHEVVTEQFVLNVEPAGVYSLHEDEISVQPNKWWARVHSITEIRD